MSLKDIVENDPVLKELDKEIEDLNRNASERMIKEHPYTVEILEKYGFNPNNLTKEELIEKKRSKSKEFWSQFDVAGRKAHHKEKMLKYDFDEHQRKVQEANLKNSWDRPYEEMQHGSLRKRLLHERNNTCEECGCKGEYNGKPLSLELEHVDGNNRNNVKYA
jgi:hypothetical protein